MNISVPRYEFCEENKPLLTNFIKKANQNKSNPFCNLSTHKSLSKILPMTHISGESPEVIHTIDLTSDIEDEEIDTILTQILEDDQQPLDKIVDDVASTIKEILQNKSNEIYTEMPDLNSKLDLDAIFNKLRDKLTVENSVDLGIMMITLYNKEDVIESYVKHILIKQLLAEHSDQLQNNLNTFCINYPNILQEELTKHLLDSSSGYSNAVLKFLTALPRQFRDKLLRNLLLTMKSLEECHFALFDALVDDRTETTSLNRLVEFMSKNRDNYTTNKIFGKFLLKVIQLLGDDLSAVEKPMSYIIETHRSIWKGKIQKIYQEFLQDNSMLSQSFSR